ncbi:MAG: glycerol acyltransferase [Saprospiraceae bacterium]|nr:glycerol acyltransferase [Saprospiraceae bacterium]
MYPQIYPNIEDWPIYKLHEDRKVFVKEIDGYVFRRIKTKHEDIGELIAKTLYMERIRMKQEPWKVDPTDERAFWKKVSNELIHKSLDKETEEARKTNEQLLEQIIHRYSEEIVGTFNKRTFLFIRRFLTAFFSRILNAVNGNFWSMRHRLYDRLQADGNVELVRELMKKGTVVVVPTHFSNLDSILVGYVLDGIVGLPSFSYGAGLNLFNAGFAAYFMNRLGAYRVDRRKKSPIYLETLKAMSTLSIKRGVNTLFFPGGTRSRSGALETKLKMGLLSTVIEAQRGIYQEDKDEKVFVVPLILGYNFVLEAKFLIEQYLRETGKELYLRSKDESNSLRKFIHFMWTLFATSNDIIVSLGQPMDVLGNRVDKNGVSYGHNNQEVDVKAYFKSFGEVNEDLQRESIYTKALADKILERYLCDNLVLSSHLVAFAAFQLLKHENAAVDLYGLLRLPHDDYYFSASKLQLLLTQLQQRLFEMEEHGKIKLSESVRGEAAMILKNGIKRLGSYHVNKPLQFKKEQIVSHSFPLLYYYQNRLSNYGLENHVDWTQIN